jgi:hypothetical protein
MKNSLTLLAISVGLAAFSNCFAQSVYTPAECKRMYPLMDERVHKAQGRFDKAKAAANDALPYLIRRRDKEIEDAPSQSHRDAAYVALISLNTAAQSVADIIKINPASCVAAKGTTLAAKLFLEGVEHEELVESVLLPNIAQARVGRGKADVETFEATALAEAGEIFGCTVPTGAAINAGYKFSKNVAEIGNVVTNARDDKNLLLEQVEMLDHYIKQHQARLLRTGTALQQAALQKKELESTCASPATKAESTVDLQKLANLGDKADKQDKFELRSVLDGAEKCTDMACLNSAMKAASKLQNDFADRSAMIATLEVTTARLDGSRASQDAADRGAAQVALQKQQEASRAAAAQAAQASESNVIGNAFQDAITSTLTGAFSSWVADRMRPNGQTSPSFAPPTITNSNASGPKTINNTSGPPCSFKCEIGTPDHCAKLMWVCSSPNK